MCRTRLVADSDILSDSSGPPLSLSTQRVYGEPLQAHLSQSSRDIALPVQQCIHMLLRTGMREEVRERPSNRKQPFGSDLCCSLGVWCPAGSVPSGSRSFSGEEAENLFGPRRGGPQRVQHGPSCCGWLDSFHSS